VHPAAFYPLFSAALTALATQSLLVAKAVNLPCVFDCSFMFVVLCDVETSIQITVPSITQWEQHEAFAL
jgi:hypothetical protein